MWAPYWILISTLHTGHYSSFNWLELPIGNLRWEFYIIFVLSGWNCYSLNILSTGPRDGILWYQPYSYPVAHLCLVPLSLLCAIALVTSSVVANQTKTLCGPTCPQECSLSSILTSIWPKCHILYLLFHSIPPFAMNVTCSFSRQL